MPNPATLHGAERTYRLDLTRTQALRALEAATGLPYLTIVRRLTWKRPPRRLMELLVQAALVDPMPLADIRAVIRDMGGIPVIQAAARAVLAPARREPRETAHA
ncbi:MAG TPA: hypothetical protein VE665_02440 [Hyphomicrobiaceae bacterium]|jgi:hypothetical protein|nr:hypothetical protein [Hyphomicrobiaceae bacterium]